MRNNTLFNYDQAPRAKMNQQRSRRFRASKEGVELVEEKHRIREEVIQRGEWCFYAAGGRILTVMSFMLHSVLKPQMKQKLFLSYAEVYKRALRTNLVLHFHSGTYSFYFQPPRRRWPRPEAWCLQVIRLSEEHLGINYSNLAQTFSLMQGWSN